MQKPWRAGGLAGLALGLIGGVLVGAVGLVPSANGASGADDSCSVKEYAMGLRYQQQSAEARALQGQSYALARRNLDKIVRGVPHRQRSRLAVMTDLDETAIDNTDLLVRDMNACHDYTTWDTWADWELHGDPRLIAGAKAFFDHADRLGVSIFYVSDRYDENKPSTMATLRSLRLPQVRDSQVLLYGPSKAVRRAAIEKHHRLVMQLGDSLPDFDGVFSGADLATQQSLVRKNARHFGWDWIVLPNPTYGSWSSAPLTAWDRPAA